MSALIELDHVTRTFHTPAGTITAVDAVSLAIEQAEAICIVGESGCGKTTRAGCSRVSSAQRAAGSSSRARRVENEGADLARFRRAVQLVHQDPYASLNPTRTVYQTLSAPLFRPESRNGRRHSLPSEHPETCRARAAGGLPREVPASLSRSAAGASRSRALSPGSARHRGGRSGVDVDVSIRIRTLEPGSRCATSSTCRSS